MSKLGINEEMSALDSKDREFYDSLSDEEKKKFSPFMMIRWGATVHGSPELQEYYLVSTNLKLNKNFFAINDTRHRKLNWLAATTISPGMGNFRHQWLAAPKKVGSNTKVYKFLEMLHPDMKIDDLQVMESINDIKTCKAMAEELGWTKEQIKKVLG